MVDWGFIVLGIALGAAVGWVVARLFSEKVAPPALPPPKPVTPAVSDPPELAWVARANGALGLWLRRSERGGITELVDPAVPEAVVRAIVGRLSGLTTPGGRSDVERLEEGNLVFVAGDDLQLAMLVPAKQPTAQALRDLESAVGMLRTRAMLELAASKSPSMQETVASIAIALAMEIEKSFGAEVAVVVRRPRGAQVMGTSLRADPHLYRLLAVPGSAVDLAVRGEVRGMVMAHDPLGVMPPDRRLRERRAFVLPITGGGEPLGAVVVWMPGGGEPSGPVRADLDRSVRGAARRLEEAMRQLELAEQAVRDPLTGLVNRRGLAEAMAHVGVTSGSLILLDLDAFKSLNDTLGHPAGDSALQAVAGIIEDMVREGDTAARVGGEEFAVWLPGGTLQEGAAAAERIRQQVASLDWGWQGRAWPLRASLGVACWPETTRSRENLFSQADSALYAAKHGGRNRVEKAVPSS
jgi:diguanylate cyclase (GGDEF)-like protein